MWYPYSLTCGNTTPSLTWHIASQYSDSNVQHVTLAHTVTGIILWKPDSIFPHTIVRHVICCSATICLPHQQAHFTGFCEWVHLLRLFFIWIFWHSRLLSHFNWSLERHVTGNRTPHATVTQSASQNIVCDDTDSRYWLQTSLESAAVIEN